MSPLIAAAVIVLCEGLCFTTALPVISFYTQQLHGTPVWVGVMFALMSGPKILSNPLWGWCSDRFGRRPVLIANTIGTLGGSVTWALAPSVGWLAISRLFIGVFGAQAILAQAIAADSSPPEKRSAAMGVLGAAFAVAFGLGPLIGGYLATNVSCASIGWLCAGLQLVSLTVISGLLRETSGASARERERRDDIANGPSWLRVEPVMNLLIITFVFTTGLSQLNSTIGLLTEKKYGYDEQHAGYMFAAFGLVAAIFQGGGVRVAIKRLGERASAILGLLLMTVGFGLLSVQASQTMMWTSVLLVAAGSSFATPCVMGLLSRHTAAERQGSMLGVNQAMTSLGRMAGAMLGAWLLDVSWGGQFAAYSSAALVVGVALAMLLLTPVNDRNSATNEASDVAPA